MLKKLMMGAAAVALSVTAMSGAANALVIDSFTTGLSVGVAGITIVDTGAVGDQTQFDRSISSLGDILGKDRELFVGNTGTVGQSVNANVAGGVFSHNNGNGTGRSLLRWDGYGTDGAGAGDTDDVTIGGFEGRNFNLGANLIGGGLLNAIHISVTQADLTGSTVTLRLFTSATQWSSALVNLPAGASEHYFLLAAIAASNPVGGGVDLMNVNAIELDAIGSASFDVGIDIIEVVPEPASLTLLGAGIMGLGYFGKRRKA